MWCYKYLAKQMCNYLLTKYVATDFIWLNLIIFWEKELEHLHIYIYIYIYICFFK